MRAAPPPAVEPVVGTVAFTDIVGFTEFTAEQGDAQALALLEEHERLLDDVLPGDARVVKSLGDGFLLWFDHPESAVEALLGFQESLQHAQGDAWMLDVRIGAHFGHPLRRGDDLHGHDVNVAARILDVAGPGEVLVSEVLVAALDERADVELRELGPVGMKGVQEPIRLYRVNRR